MPAPNVAALPHRITVHLEATAELLSSIYAMGARRGFAEADGTMGAAFLEDIEAEHATRVALYAAMLKATEL